MPDLAPFAVAQSMAVAGDIAINVAGHVRMLVSEAGYATDAGLLRGYAETHGMPVAMANHGGPTGGWISAGRSAVWDEAGRIVVAAPGVGEYLLVAQRTNGRWHGRTIAG